MQKQSRRKVYDLPHRGIRNAFFIWLFETGKTDPYDPKDVLKFISISQEVFRILEVHAEDEESVSLRRLALIDPSFAAEDKEEHKKLETKIGELRQITAAISELLEQPEALVPKLSEFYDKLISFQLAYSNHMEHEEKITQEKIWESFSDSELEEQQKQIIISLNASDLVLWRKYIAPTLPPRERIGFESMTGSILNSKSN
ncbi:hemerythrin domain-containing protein [Leptospira sp. 201903071]|uniref:hemerythrin domain-containing protein n=1 Tax=Leptospira ainazelensis TaxID=2810034 RepID=UPI001965CDAD|nr:hemerythrin domain-containing protein [Leptospira ainazelensis]MBM9499269.1 hemerythrin domain-containing protein [Leptospira ainazelensis]